MGLKSKLLIGFIVILIIIAIILGLVFGLKKSNNTQNIQQNRTSEIIKPTTMPNVQQNRTSELIKPTTMPNVQQNRTSELIKPTTMPNVQQNTTSELIKPTTMDNKQIIVTTPIPILTTSNPIQKKTFILRDAITMYGPKKYILGNINIKGKIIRLEYNTQIGKNDISKFASNQISITNQNETNEKFSTIFTITDGIVIDPITSGLFTFSINDSIIVEPTDIVIFTLGTNLSNQYYTNIFLSNELVIDIYIDTSL